MEAPLKPPGRGSGRPAIDFAPLQVHTLDERTFLSVPRHRCFENEDIDGNIDFEYIITLIILEFQRISFRLPVCLSRRVCRNLFTDFERTERTNASRDCSRVHDFAKRFSNFSRISIRRERIRFPFVAFRSDWIRDAWTDHGRYVFFDRLQIFVYSRKFFFEYLSRTMRNKEKRIGSVKSEFLATRSIVSFPR